MGSPNPIINRGTERAEQPPHPTKLSFFEIFVDAYLGRLFTKVYKSGLNSETVEFVSTRSSKKEFLDLGNVSGNIVLDATNVSVFVCGVKGPTKFDFNLFDKAGHQEIALYLKSAGSYLVQWPNSVQWLSGSHPNLKEDGTDRLRFTTMDGGRTWYGSVAN